MILFGELHVRLVQVRAFSPLFVKTGPTGPKSTGGRRKHGTAGLGAAGRGAVRLMGDFGAFCLKYPYLLSL